MSLEAMLWALDTDVPDPMSRVILINLANYAGEAGRGAWPSQDKLLTRAGCSRASLNRKLAQLETLGLIKRGDQAMLAHLPANRRPVVWDLNLTGEAWGLNLRPQNETPEPVDNDAETVDNPVDSTELGVSDSTSWGLTAETQTVLDPKDTLTQARPACSTHATTAGHCRGCGTAPRDQGTNPRTQGTSPRARQAEEAEAARARARARQTTIAACPDCDPQGWLTTSDGRVRRCTHVGLRSGTDVYS